MGEEKGFVLGVVLGVPVVFGSSGGNQPLGRNANVVLGENDTVGYWKS